MTPDRIKVYQPGQINIVKECKLEIACCCCSVVAKLCLTLLLPHGLQYQATVLLLSPWDFPGKNTEGGCHFLLQNIPSIIVVCEGRKRNKIYNCGFRFLYQVLDIHNIMLCMC